MINFGAFPGLKPHFEIKEYENRRRRLMAQIEEQKLDALIVTAGEDITYLTGFDVANIIYFAPIPLIVSPEHGYSFIVRRYDEDAVRAGALVDEVTSYRQLGDAAGVFCSELMRLRLDGGRLGYQPGRGNLLVEDFHFWRERLPNAEFIDASDIISWMMALKSEAELECMRQSMVGTKAAIKAFEEGVSERESEVEIVQRMSSAIEASGVESAPQLTSLVVGERTAIPHGRPTNLRIKNGDAAFTEVGGWKHGYSAGLCRTAVIGRNKAAETLYGVAKEALLAAIEKMRPGVEVVEADKAARGIVNASRYHDAFRHRTGYLNGYGWTRRGYLSIEPGVKQVFEPGMTFHVPIILFEEGRIGVGVSESVLVTPSGPEIMSGLEQDIIMIPQ